LGRDTKGEGRRTVKTRNKTKKKEIGWRCRKKRKDKEGMRREIGNERDGME